MLFCAIKRTASRSKQIVSDSVLKRMISVVQVNLSCTNIIFCGAISSVT